MQLHEVRPITFQGAIKRALVRAGTFDEVFGDHAEKVATACMEKPTAKIYRLETAGDPVAQVVIKALKGQQPLEQFGDAAVLRLPGSNRAVLFNDTIYVGERSRDHLIEGKE